MRTEEKGKGREKEEREKRERKTLILESTGDINNMRFFSFSWFSGILFFVVIKKEKNKREERREEKRRERKTFKLPYFPSTITTPFTLLSVATKIVMNFLKKNYLKIKIKKKEKKFKKRKMRKKKKKKKNLSWHQLCHL